MSFSHSLAQFLQNLLLNSNLARWYLGNVGSDNDTARLPMRPQERVAVTICPLSMCFLELALRPFFQLFLFLMCLNHQVV